MPDDLTQMGIVGVIAIFVVRESFALIKSFSNRNNKNGNNLVGILTKLNEHMIKHEDSSNRLIRATEKNVELIELLHNDMQAFWREMLERTGK